MAYKLNKSVILLMCLLATSLVNAQSYPSKPIRMITPDPPGGVVDRLLRRLNERVAANLKQPIILENRPGADGMIGLDACAKAPADGYTICGVTVAFMSIVPNIRKVPIDPLTDLAPVTPLVKTGAVMFANAAVPANTVAQLISQAKANPGRLSYASFGNGTAPHIYFEWFKKEAGVDLLHVPYQGGPPAFMGVMGGSSDVGFFALGFAVPHIKSGKIKALAVASTTRSPLLPDVPTLKEAGMDYPLEAWFGIVAPRGTPDAIRSMLAVEYAKIIAEPEFRKTVLEQDAYEPFTSTPAAFGEFLRVDRDRYARFINAAGIKAD